MTQTPSAENLFANVDPLNFSTVRLLSLRNDLELGPATGFFFYGMFEGHPNYWLVTNWHVLTGRNADQPAQALHSNGALPNGIRIQLPLRFNQPEYLNRNVEIFFQDQSLSLYDNVGHALWYQHVRKNEVDVAVVNLGRAVAERFYLVGVNEVPACNDMAIEIGNDIFILGYPLGFTHFVNTPIWKRGSIASEPHIETAETKFRVVIDATTRGGMSSGPVIMRAKTHYLNETGKVVEFPNATRWIGVYSSRPNIAPNANALEEDRRAEVGYFYKNGWVPEIITSGIRGPDLDMMP
jgi:hypothetical protein